MRAPDLSFNGHDAWFVHNAGPQWNACVAFWYVRLKDYHPMLEWFAVIASHLRDEPGAPKANKNQSTSSHEIVIAAVDPEPFLLEEFDPDSKNSFKLLMPLEIVHQFSNITDDQAQIIAILTVDELTDRKLSPDRDQFHDWLKMFNEWVACFPEKTCADPSKETT